MEELMGYDALVVFDTETTGLSPVQNRIIELAAIRIDANGEDEMDLLIKLPAGERIPEKITDLTHITDEMLETDGVGEAEAAERFAQMLRGEGILMIAHNAQFDLGFVRSFISRNRDNTPGLEQSFERADYMDTVTILKDRKAYPHKLCDAIENYGLQGQVENSHRAVDDCKALYEVVKAMYAERDDLAEYVNVFGYNPRYGVSGQRIGKVSYYAQSFHNNKVAPEQILPRVGR